MNWIIAIAALIIGWALGSVAQAQTVGPSRAQISRPVDESQRVAFAGNTRPEANARNDRGPVAYNLPLEHIQMLLHRPNAQERALEKLIDALHDRASPSFHKWLTPRDLGERFGVARQDIAKISAWLARYGFTVNPLLPGRMILDFSGTAGQVREAFHTEIHDLDVNGEHHIANMSDPQMPAALAPAIVGIVSLNDFRPEPQYTYPTPPNPPGPCQPLDKNTGNPVSVCYYVVPADLWTIYNFTPTFAAGNSGQEQTVIVLEDVDFYNSSGDWNTFRSTFLLSQYGGTLKQVHPNVGNGTSCSDPVKVYTPEANLDAEWAGAAAPGATIEVDSCADVAPMPGYLIALENRTSQVGPPPQIATISGSFGRCEADNGATLNATINTVYQLAVAQGYSLFVSTGDSGAAGCDRGTQPHVAQRGIAVNAYASSPYVVAVGGTDFGDTYAGLNSMYWNGSNGPGYGSAVSYVPEIAYNDSCTSALLATYYWNGNTYGTSSFCNNLTTAQQNYFLNSIAGSGGPSSCAYLDSKGQCQGYQKPSWQVGLMGNPSDGVRDIPDVSLFAGGGAWGHTYIYCYSNPLDHNSKPCTGAPNTWSRSGGTSFATPIWAGIQALVNSKTQQFWGNPDRTYYMLAKAEYNPAGNGACNSSLGNRVAPTCIFYDVTQGDMDVACAGTVYCFLDSATIGILTTDATGSIYKAAYPATTGWDFATGIGTVNVTNLVNDWP